MSMNDSLFCALTLRLVFPHAGMRQRVALALVVVVVVIVRLCVAARSVGWLDAKGASNSDNLQPNDFDSTSHHHQQQHNDITR